MSYKEFSNIDMWNFDFLEFGLMNKFTGSQNKKQNCTRNKEPNNKQIISCLKFNLTLKI